MKNGIELKKNGNMIIKRNGIYYVEKLNRNSVLVPSRNGPWDYLGNARSDSNGYYDE